MTNEALAKAIQAGDSGRIMDLWQQVRRFAMQKVRRWACFGRGGAALEDLQQAAFLAFLYALEGWSQDKGCFLTWYGLQIKAALTEATGQQTERERRDPLEVAASLDAPITDAPDGVTLADAIPDPRAEQEIEGVAELDLAERRHEAIRQALDTLPEDQRRAVVLWYWFGEKTDSRAHSKALRALRRPDVSRGLRQYLAPG